VLGALQYVGMISARGGGLIVLYGAGFKRNAWV
jgi:hypothetical protein